MMPLAKPMAIEANDAQRSQRVIFFGGTANFIFVPRQLGTNPV
jgi:hypothetical protein